MLSQFSISDRTYFARRAREERERAAPCEDNSVALAHLRLADEYDRLVKSCDETVKTANMR